MKIGSLESQAPVASTPTERKAAPAAPGAKGEASARVDLSANATLLSGASSDPVFDSHKVDRIAQAIRDGRFEVNATAIADKLISNAKELLSPRLS